MAAIRMKSRMMILVDLATKMKTVQKNGRRARSCSHSLPLSAGSRSAPPSLPATKAYWGQRWSRPLTIYPPLAACALWHGCWDLTWGAQPQQQNRKRPWGARARRVGRARGWVTGGARARSTVVGLRD